MPIMVDTFSQTFSGLVTTVIFLLLDYMLILSYFLAWS